MRRSYKQGLALTAVAGMLLAGCGDGQSDDEAQEAPAQTEGTSQPDTETTEGSEPDEKAPGDPTGSGQAMEDPNEDVEDGVYRGNGVVLPVPDGWSMDPTAISQGVVAAVSEDGTQQMTARAVETEDTEAAGQAMDLDSLVDSVREQVGQDAEVDEGVELDGAERAHRLTYLDLPAQQEGGPDSSATIVIAEGDGLVGEFALSAPTENYDKDAASLLVEQAGFDPNSEPPALPQQPAPQG